MSVSSEVKEFLREDIVKHKPCCNGAFHRGERGDGFEGGCKECLRAYVSGVFASFGTLSDPAKSFHLSIKADRPFADSLRGLLGDAGLAPRVSPLKHGVRLYYKDSAQIEDFLTFIGGSRFALRIMDIKIIKGLRNKENRLSNAEYANIDRAATAAAEQLKAIEALRAHGALDSLPEELAHTAALREENPFMPLSELRLQFSPPISKSGLNYRLNRLIEESEKIKG